MKEWSRIRFCLSLLVLTVACRLSLAAASAQAAQDGTPPSDLTQATAPTATPTPVNRTEPAGYLGSLGQTIYNPEIQMPNTPHYGQVHVACRTGWRFIQPTDAAHFDWTTIDTCRAQAIAAQQGARWEISIRPGADTPLWLYNSSCTATPVKGEGGPGGGSVNAMQFMWTQPYEYPQGSTQCTPVPWDKNYLTAFQTFISAVGAHVAELGAPFPHHVVATGINAITQENILPACSVSDSTCGAPPGTTDEQNWTTILARNGLTTDQFNPRVSTAYKNIIGYWNTAFPGTPLATMYVDGASFPFNKYPPPNTWAPATYLIQELPNDLITMGRQLGFQSIVMSNAADSTHSSPPTALLVAKVLCYQGIATPNNNCSGYPTSTIAFQELKGVGCTTTPTEIDNLLNTANADGSLFMEIYANDVTCLANGK